MRRALTTAAVLCGIVAAPASAAQQQVFAFGNQFAPPAVAAGQGDSLQFVNSDLASHNVTSVPAGLFGTKGNITPGSSGEVVGVSGLTPGDYRFVCTLHPGMSGVLHVGAAGAPGVPVAAPSTSSSNPLDLLPKVLPAPLTGGDWPFYGRDLTNSRNGGINGPSWNEVVTMGPVWSFHSTNGDFTGTPVVSRGTLVAAAFGGTVFALDASTGRLRWSHNFKLPINGSAAISGGRVFVPLAKTGGPMLAALKLKNGRLLWRRRIDSQHDSDVYGSPVVWRSRVYIGVSALNGELSDPEVRVRGAVVALSVRRGRILWKTYTVPRGHDGGAVWSTPAIDTRTGRLYVGTGNAYHAPAASTTDSVLALSARRGRRLGHFQATVGDTWNVGGNALGGPDADFGASPQLIHGADGRPLIGAGQKSGTYWAFARRTLRPAWKTTVGPSASFAGGIVGSTAYDGLRIYGPNTPAGEVWGIDTGGRLAWVSSDGGPLHFGPVSVANGVVYSTDMSGLLTARDASTGVVLARLPLGGASWGGVSIAGGYVFAVTGIEGGSGYVVAYRPRG
jgi:polyvinyl alcohol dehydrogenase (cytochrome)